MCIQLNHSAVHLKHCISTIFQKKYLAKLIQLCKVKKKKKKKEIDSKIWKTT